LGKAWAFLAGLPLGALLIAATTDWHQTSFPSRPMLIAAGLLVGVGTRLGSGCTSGHGGCGISPVSKSSLVATATFSAAGVATVFLPSKFGAEQ
jgi:uncharacterized membrane protein YedE/YeeE